MKYRAAIEAALQAWEGIWFHWRKSEASKSASVILHRLIADSPYDDQLQEAVNWFLGKSDQPFHYVVSFAKLSTDSALFAQLTNHLQNAEPPNLRPVLVMHGSSASRPQQPASSAPRAGSGLVVAPQAASSNSVPVLGAQPAASSSIPVVTARAASSGSENTVELQIRKHQRIWQAIEITDIPTGKHGRYIHTADDPLTTQQKGSAAAIVKKQLKFTGNAFAVPAYWIELGRLVFKYKKGRCFSCAGAALYTLTLDQFFDIYELAVMGTRKYDHYFVCVGTTMGQITSGLGSAIDIWQSNLSGSSDVFAHTPAKDFMYWKDAEIICLIPRSERQALRTFVAQREEIEHPTY
ncbi:hypothetical protein [Pseudomonas chlororaphis]|uniref:hypothetical protein n=1 Tax=Pseudomonas chlororaphis TaxID=587753 RepID=UPI0003D2FA15|nr:hypothetical protein [Pseudomonas chlororaphis]AZD29211.1 hypothetical protein C4K23_2462 [Pseudomonas chlororaphis]ETD37996.1 hypothetical protein U724_20275 [Pseudomonas chlororaphis subsp. aurantiaca PB-St2]QFS54719.1 hypothetical protein FD951_09190 [Pseudomonas chlororaphis subsp. aurantiaca]